MKIIPVPSMNKKIPVLISICLALLLIFTTSADILPNGTNTTNRQIPSESYLEVIGSMSSHQEYRLETSSHGGHEGGFLYDGERVSSVVYKSDMATNGGYLAQSKGLVIDEGAKQKGAYNVDSKIVTTYLTDPEIGSKMASSDSVEMFNSGNYSLVNRSVRNPLVADIIGDYVGGFNSHYKGASAVELTTGQLATMAKARSVGTDNTVPAEIGYLIGIHPDMSSGIPYAAGTASTEFKMTTEQGASTNTTDLATNKMIEDKTTVDGQIFTFGKSFTVTSGLSPF